jgi:hypothetical protein
MLSKIVLVSHAEVERIKAEQLRREALKELIAAAVHTKLRRR